MSAIVVRLQNVSKFYKLYDSKRERLKEALDPRRRKRYREFYALRGINLEIKKGEILGVVGRNGAGKSTLLKLIAGVIPPSNGQVAVKGRVSALLDMGAGLNPNLDGIQNIIFGGIMLGFSRKEMMRKLDEIVDFADIGDFIRQPMRTYSTGMRARLGFALAVNVNPDILVVDEVLAVGDELFRRKCYSHMEALLKAGCTVLYVSHNTGTINELCTRAIMLESGRILLDASPKHVTMNYLKLLYIPWQKSQQAIREIENLQNNPDKFRTEPLASYDLLEKRMCMGDEIPLFKQNSENEAFFIPKFVSPCRLEENNLGTKIEDIVILDHRKEKVNALVLKNSYSISFQVHFAQDAQNVGIGINIKNEKGRHISNFDLGKKLIPHISGGTRMQVRLQFRCIYLPGNYYVNLSVGADSSGERIVLSHFQDALAFKVQPIKKESGYSGLIYCDHSLDISFPNKA
jgi:lipopolysaccharide transport system ATP-binding protein